MEVYLDNAATTKVFPEVIEIMNKIMNEDYGNPSSLHIKGINAEKYIKTAKDIIGKELKVNSKNIYFTSGGTESNNLALIGCALANKRRGMHIISTRIEHPSVYNPLLYLEELGFEISFLEVDEHGIVDMDHLKAIMREDTILVSTMLVNNEIGAIEPVEAISKYIKSVNSKVLYHVDAIQAFGKMRIYPSRCGIDLMSVSGHKLHGPKGIGFIYIGDGVKIKSILFGGGQEKNMRSGTENVPGIAGVGKATEIIYKNLDERIEHYHMIKNRFINKIMEIENVSNNSGDAPHIASISFGGIKSEVLLHALEERYIYVSSGSACSSNHPSISGVLEAIHLDKNMLESTLRFSFSMYNTIEDIDYTVNVIKELVPVLRKYTRR